MKLLRGHSFPGSPKQISRWVLFLCLPADTNEFIKSSEVVTLPGQVDKVGKLRFGRIRGEMENEEEEEEEEEEPR